MLIDDSDVFNNDINFYGNKLKKLQLLYYVSKYGLISDSGHSKIGTQYNRPLHYKGHRILSIQYQEPLKESNIVLVYTPRL